MLESCIYNILDHIFPNTGKSKNDILRLEYLCACNIMENKKDILKKLQLVPARLYNLLLQSVIHNCYFKFINSINRLDISTLDNYTYNCLQVIDIPFPETLGILILNWPYEELILRDKISSLEQPVDIFPSQYYQLSSQRQAFGEVGAMLEVFNVFCERLIQFITRAVFKGTHTNAKLTSYRLRKLDVSGLVNIGDNRSTLLSDDILKEITNSKIATFGTHNIDLYTDAGSVEFSGGAKKFVLLRNIIEHNLKPGTGLSVYFKTISAFDFSKDSLPHDSYNLLARGRCEYIDLRSGFNIDQSFVNLCIYLPGLVGISLFFTERITNLEFLSLFQYLEQLCINDYTNNGMTNEICNMRKGLKYLSLDSCSLKRKDLECLANSIHSHTLQQLDIRNNNINNDTEAVGLITLCQNLKNIKVLILAGCSLESLSSHSISKVVVTITFCVKLEFLSMIANPFSHEITNIIIDGLAQKKSLRYLSIDLPNIPRWNDEYDIGNNYEDYDEEYYNDEYVKENMEYQQNLYKTFNEKINEFRHYPIYISWNL